MLTILTNGHPLTRTKFDRKEGRHVFLSDFEVSARPGARQCPADFEVSARSRAVFGGRGAAPTRHEREPTRQQRE